MRKNKGIKRRVPTPDYKYNNPIVSKFINYLMSDGKKNVARTVVYDAFDIVAEKTKKDPMEIFDEALKNVSPQVEVKSKRVGGANYQVPMQVKGERRMMLAMRWMREAAQTKKGRPMRERLADELIAAAKNEGDAVRKKENTERMAAANKAFAHFA
ncbi:MAG: 30S ribosomal protein S7 [Candidatus Spechtbacteria bacterium RIFCSPLOWO2_01_FULL_46_10]|uniref:Small ribosomal subunit protein uS7 n=1 Tax=Candidatus Spechtbacteria bacterium RIFCSPLOWO2_01_FULL_46_10 TaxID=1802163 RepID=A0A1G2HG99_9BACT|nr:MAG: 30S ribosomal protein S7 [Candidatus Spechtbacteria bacterium RIFCSPLOWO2_01_FULL_46_10]